MNYNFFANKDRDVWFSPFKRIFNGLSMSVKNNFLVHAPLSKISGSAPARKAVMNHKSQIQADFIKKGSPETQVALAQNVILDCLPVIVFKNANRLVKLPENIVI